MLMIEAEGQLHRLLSHLEERIDLGHVRRARVRHRRALDYEELDRPPVVFYLPYEGEEFRPYPFAEAFASPAKLAVNELLIGFTSLYHAVELRDDAPYCLRPNLGTGLVASMFGAEVCLKENNPPWIMPVGEQRIRDIATGPLPDLRSGLAARALDQYAFFGAMLSDYPHCRQAFQLTLPDLQGPFSTAELLWGPGIYLALCDEPGLVSALLERIVGLMVAVYGRLVAVIRDDLGAGYCYQHAVGTRGSILVRNDSMVNLSARHYREVILPHDVALSECLGRIGVHFCGRGMHQVANLLAIPGLGCLDLGNPEMLDLNELYRQAAPLGVALVRLMVPEEHLRSSALARRFPSGVSLVCYPRSVAHAQELLRRYLAR
jgi:hypothetical protein